MTVSRGITKRKDGVTEINLCSTWFAIKVPANEQYWVNIDGKLVGYTIDGEFSINGLDYKWHRFELVPIAQAKKEAA
jgi:hypothetical protein